MEQGISESRLHHLLGVARKAYKIAKERGHSEDFARKCFLLGWLHDVGYEFCDKEKDHAAVGADMLLLLDCNEYEAVSLHGKYMENMTEEYRILNMADMQVDAEGNEVDVTKRLEEIKERFGEHSDKYLTACDICFRLGLTAINVAGNIT